MMNLLFNACMMSVLLGACGLFADLAARSWRSPERTDAHAHARQAFLLHDEPIGPSAPPTSVDTQADAPRVGYALDVPEESPELRVMGELAELAAAFDAIITELRTEPDYLAQAVSGWMESREYRRLRLIGYQDTAEYRVVPTHADLAEALLVS